MKNTVIDINVDVGEGVNNETLFMPVISSCNIACGGHAGDVATMRSVAKLAQQNKVNVGAHPSFPDRENFGRTAMDLSAEALFKSLKLQVNQLCDVLEVENIKLHHLKPHGALYNLAATDAGIASVVIALMKSLDSQVKLYVPFRSVIADLAIQNNIPMVYEAFADRNYNTDLTLVARSHSNALIQDAETMYRHVFNMVKHNKVKTITGQYKTIQAETFCLHGDNDQVVELINSLTQQLSKNGISVL